VDSLNEEIQREQLAMEAERNAPAMTDETAPGAHWPALRQMFPARLARQRWFSPHRRVLRTVRGGLADDRLIMAAFSGGSEGVGVRWRLVVPAAYVQEVLDASLEEEIVRPRAAVRPMETNSLWVAGFDTLNHSTSIGGFSASWIGEGTSFTFQKAKLRGLQLAVKKLGILTLPARTSCWPTRPLSRRASRADDQGGRVPLDEAFLRGNGAGKPRGVLNDPALITVLKEAGQVADTINWENLKRCTPACIRRARSGRCGA
jgi:hypothetical protein